MIDGAGLDRDFAGENVFGQIVVAKHASRRAFVCCSAAVPDLVDTRIGGVPAAAWTGGIAPIAPAIVNAVTSRPTVTVTSCVSLVVTLRRSYQRNQNIVF